MRLSRKNWTAEDMGLLSASLTDLFDSAIKQTLRITDAELDYIAENASSKQLDILFDANESFASRRRSLIILFKLLEDYQKTL